jgi:hypothetical protein
MVRQAVASSQRALPREASRLCMLTGLEFAGQAFSSEAVYPMTASIVLAYTAGQATGKEISVGDREGPLLSIGP